LSGITRLVRRVCLLREQGDTAAAARLEQDELGTAVRDLRLAHGLEVVRDEELQELFAREEQRVADAVILAELLAPRLAAARPSAPAVHVTTTAPVRREDFSPAPRVVESGAGSTAIPDLLDAMLAADRTARR
jgi:hypothetical protein